MLAAFNGNLVFEGPGPLFCDQFGPLFGPFGAQSAHWGRFWALHGGSGRPKLGRSARPWKTGYEKHRKSDQTKPKSYLTGRTYD